eukprot:GGOE01044519.1.p1 GENE.GGOE01044519.1~~GGOE01044519.1.p1  ORF type:complete len:472 (-),score=69.30 GGOE01044519.1:213-1445(-)
MVARPDTVIAGSDEPQGSPAPADSPQPRQDSEPTEAVAEEQMSEQEPSVAPCEASRQVNPCQSVLKETAKKTMQWVSMEEGIAEGETTSPPLSSAAKVPMGDSSRGVQMGTIGAGAKCAGGSAPDGEVAVGVGKQGAVLAADEQPPSRATPRRKKAKVQPGKAQGEKVHSERSVPHTGDEKDEPLEAPRAPSPTTVSSASRSSIVDPVQPLESLPSAARKVKRGLKSRLKAVGHVADDPAESGAIDLDGAVDVGVPEHPSSTAKPQHPEGSPPLPLDEQPAGGLPLATTQRVKKGKKAKSKVRGEEPPLKENDRTLPETGSIGADSAAIVAQGVDDGVEAPKTCAPLTTADAPTATMLAGSVALEAASTSVEGAMAFGVISPLPVRLTPLPALWPSRLAPLPSPSDPAPP